MSEDELALEPLTDVGRAANASVAHQRAIANATVTATGGGVKTWTYTPPDEPEWPPRTVTIEVAEDDPDVTDEPVTEENA